LKFSRPDTNVVLDREDVFSIRPFQRFNFDWKVGLLVRVFSINGMPLDLGDTQILIFEIPYGIRIEDGFRFEQHEDEVELELYGGDDPPEIEVMLNGRFVSLRFNERTNRDQIYFEGPFTVEGDRLGRSLSTEILMHFSDEFMESIPSEVVEETPTNYHEKGTMFGSDISPPLDKHIVVWGVNFLNKFLEHYRFFENEYWLSPLTPQTIQDFHLWRFKNGDLDRYRHRIWTRGPSKGGSADTGKMQEFLRSETRIPLLQRLRLNSRDNIDVGDYQEAIIQSAQLFELWIISAYILISKSRGVDEFEAEDQITKPNGDFFHPYNIMDKLNSEFGYDFKVTDQFDYWENSTKEIRNDIIHSGYEPTRSEAFDAFEASMDAIYKIQEEFKRDISDSVIDEIFERELPGSNILIEKERESE
jgi:hypothetical protein